MQVDATQRHQHNAPVVCYDVVSCNSCRCVWSRLFGHGNYFLPSLMVWCVIGVAIATHTPVWLPSNNKKRGKPRMLFYALTVCATYSTLYIYHKVWL
ncbi:hypothetical protein GGS24DRAFT_453809 [Hypoxylon argillaceum]|nr:hypothetical protein GGS24DRAFT_453809 [Hypoxylon argillaceum]